VLLSTYCAVGKHH